MASTLSPQRAALLIGLGNMLRAARLEAGYSARGLARAVGRSHPWVRDLEAGVRPPSATMAGRVSRALDLDPWADALLCSMALDDEPRR